MAENTLGRNLHIYVVSLALYMIQLHHILQNTTEHSKKEHSPCNMMQIYLANSGYQLFTQWISSRSKSYTIDWESPHTKLSRRRNWASISYTPMAANARPSFLSIRWKGQYKSIEGIFVGYSDDSKAYKIWIPRTHNTQGQGCYLWWV